MVVAAGDKVAETADETAEDKVAETADDAKDLHTVRRAMRDEGDQVSAGRDRAVTVSAISPAGRAPGHQFLELLVVSLHSISSYI